MLQRITFTLAVLSLSLAAGCASQPAPWERADARANSQAQADAQSTAGGTLPLGAGDTLGARLFSDNSTIATTSDPSDLHD